MTVRFLSRADRRNAARSKTLQEEIRNVNTQAICQMVWWNNIPRSVGSKEIVMVLSWYVTGEIAWQWAAILALDDVVMGRWTKPQPKQKALFDQISEIKNARLSNTRNRSR